jgi:hypothetical protein
MSGPILFLYALLALFAVEAALGVVITALAVLSRSRRRAAH